MQPLTLSNRWVGISNNLRLRVARDVDRAETARRIEALLREHGQPIAFEVFDREFVLCEPHLPGVKGDPDIAIVLGDAEYELFFVAQRERGGLSAVSIHETIHDAVGNFLVKAIGPEGLKHIPGLIARVRNP